MQMEEAGRLDDQVRRESAVVKVSVVRERERERERECCSQGLCSILLSREHICHIIIHICQIKCDERVL